MLRKWKFNFHLKIPPSCTLGIFRDYSRHRRGKPDFRCSLRRFLAKRRKMHWKMSIETVSNRQRKPSACRVCLCKYVYRSFDPSDAPRMMSDSIFGVWWMTTRKPGCTSARKSRWKINLTYQFD